MADRRAGVEGYRPEHFPVSGVLGVHICEAVVCPSHRRCRRGLRRLDDVVGDGGGAEVAVIDDLLALIARVRAGVYRHGCRVGADGPDQYKGQREHVDKSDAAVQDWNSNKFCHLSSSFF